MGAIGCSNIRSLLVEDGGKDDHALIFPHRSSACAKEYGLALLIRSA